MDQIGLQNCYISQLGSVMPRPSTPNYSMSLPYDRQVMSSASSYYFPPEFNVISEKESNLQKANFPSKCANNFFLPQSQNNKFYHEQKINLNATVTLDLEHNVARKQQSSMSPSQKQTIKPKIHFSYNRDKSITQKDRKKGSLSLNNKEELEPQFTLNEFELFNCRKSKEQKKLKLKIQSNLLNYVYLSSNETKKQTSSSQIMDKSSQSGIPTKCSGTSGTSINSNSYFQQHQNRLSKMSSVKNTQSFLVNTRRSGFPRQKKQIKSNQKQNHEQHQPNHSCSSKKPSLMDKLPTSKNLKKTIILGTYDFGGIFIQKNAGVDQKSSKLPFRDKALKQSSDYKWKNIVKCLVQQQNETQNLKQSIHFGPQIRLQKYNCSLLNKFGRNIAQSFIPSND